MQVLVLTPGRRVYKGPARGVTIPGVDGEIGILPRHAPMIAGLGFGELRIVSEKGEAIRYVVSEGLTHVAAGQASSLPDLRPAGMEPPEPCTEVTVLAGWAQEVAEIDQEKVKADLKKAEETRPDSILGWEDRARRIDQAHILLRIQQRS